ncbi:MULTISPECIES: aspartyl-phosphate phosphatase Spo0E family protein [Paenibacillus]|uniref:aspartyl-phosphate phosphatase Spo0E family protein n=1 Tax=Paenibacillus TaxID=44249 RepID=UPI0022B8D099|nr:aspartyl-phosphate phosphatase Spo0E family protein [Paenibacillus caseinilyticus]MCZ8519223.1 aspartyl-phosphate phosphatase Spo0E family protein [Paenibacillus caseinilyticus]
MNVEKAEYIISHNHRRIEQLITTFGLRLSDPVVVELSQEMDTAVVYLQKMLKAARPSRRCGSVRPGCWHFAGLLEEVAAEVG